MTTLGELAAAVLPGAVRVGAAGDDRSIAWARVLRARVPAFDALEPGDLAIVPLGTLGLVAPGADGASAVVEACARADAAGVLIVEAESDDGAAIQAGTALEAALVGRGVPGMRVPRTDVPTLERTIIGCLVNERAELERQAGVLEDRLERLALAGGGADALVVGIAGFVGRSVALEGSRGAVVSAAAPPSRPDLAAEAARASTRARGPVALRVRLPVPAAASAVPGALVLLGAAPVTELERAVVARVAGLVALELAREEAVRTATDRSRRAEALPSGGPPWVVAIARQRTPGPTDDAPDGRNRREATRRDLRLLAPARRMALRGDADSLEVRAVLAAGGERGVAEALDLAGRMAAFLARTVAVSRPFAIPAGRPAAEAEARSTLEAAEALAEPPSVARADRQAAYRLLGGLQTLPDGERQARALLAPLLAGRTDVRREHLATLRALLDHGGVNEAAAALGVHRNTIAYRVRRIEALTGWRLADPDLRLPLALALRFVQDDQV